MYSDQTWYLMEEIFAEQVFANFANFGQIQEHKSQGKSNFAYSRTLIS